MHGMIIIHIFTISFMQTQMRALTTYQNKNCNKQLKQQTKKKNCNKQPKQHVTIIMEFQLCLGTRVSTLYASPCLILTVTFYELLFHFVHKGTNYTSEKLRNLFKSSQQKEAYRLKSRSGQIFTPLLCFSVFIYIGQEFEKSYKPTSGMKQNEK